MCPRTGRYCDPAWLDSRGGEPARAEPADWLSEALADEMDTMESDRRWLRPWPLLAAPPPPFPPLLTLGGPLPLPLLLPFEDQGIESARRRVAPPEATAAAAADAEVDEDDGTMVAAVPVGGPPMEWLARWWLPRPDAVTGSARLADVVDGVREDDRLFCPAAATPCDEDDGERDALGCWDCACCGRGAMLANVMRHRTSSPAKTACSNQRTDTRMLLLLLLLLPPLPPAWPPKPKLNSRAMAAAAHATSARGHGEGHFCAEAPWSRRLLRRQEEEEGRSTAVMSVMAT